eukprot:8422836-Pyramimonas_sp.AAC.1
MRRGLLREGLGNRSGSLVLLGEGLAPGGDLLLTISRETRPFVEERQTMDARRGEGLLGNTGAPPRGAHARNIRRERAAGVAAARRQESAASEAPVSPQTADA